MLYTYLWNMQISEEMFMIITELELKKAVFELPYAADKEQLFNHLVYFIKQDKRDRKVKNGLNSLAKAKASGRTKYIGRPKIRNDEQIKQLRASGLTYREIAKEIGLSTTAVQRCLNGKK